MSSSFPENPHLTARTANGILWLTLNRPEDLNAVDEVMLQGLEAAMALAAASPEIRCVVIKGAGRAFCAGADLKNALRLGKEGLQDFLSLARRTFALVRDCPKPVIAGLNGITVAGGLELALACDILVASETATVGDAHVNFGVFPGAGGAAILPRRIGYHAAAHLLFTGGSVSADRMFQLGLVQEVWPAADFLVRLEGLADRIASKSPEGLARIKTVARSAADISDAAALGLEAAEAGLYSQSPDFDEGIKAFVEKRKPIFRPIDQVS